MAWERSSGILVLRLIAFYFYTNTAYFCFMRFRILIPALWVLFFSCGKGGSNAPVKPAFTFTATYDSFLTTYANKNYVLPFSITVLSGDISGNPVTFSLSGLPSNISVTPVTQTVTGALSGVFTFSFGTVTPGMDTFLLTIKCDATGTQVHKLVMTILPSPDYSGLLAGDYPHSYTYATPRDTTMQFDAQVGIVTGTPYAIKIMNAMIFDTVVTINASLTNIVNIPFQSLGSYKMWGRGIYTHDNPPYDTLYELTLYDTTAHGNDTEACLIHIQH